MQYFLDGPVDTKANFVLSTQINGLLYILNSYTDSSGAPAIFFDDNIPAITASGSDISSVPVFNAVKAGNGVNLVTASSNGLSFDNANKATIRTTPAILTPNQNIYAQPNDAIFLSGVQYTLNNSSGTPITFDYGSSVGCTGGSTGGVNASCINITGTATNVLALPQQWYFGCQGINYNSSNTAAGSICSAFCTISPNSPLCTDVNNSLCTNYQSQGWTQLSDCKVGVPFNYCAVGKNCGDGGCNGTCSSSLSTCTYTSGAFKCTAKEVEGIPWWGWVIIAIVVIIVLITILALFFKK